MAAFTTQRAGNWSLPSDNASSPWHDGGAQTALARVPTSGDTIVHAFNGLLTVDTAQSIGTGTGTAISQTGGSSCRVVVSANLTIAGDWVHNQTIGSLQANPTVDIAAGVSVTFDASAGRCKWQLISANSQFTWIRSNGSAGSLCTITATGGDFYFTRGAFIVGGYYDFLYTTISNCYDGTRYAYNVWPGNSGGYHKIRNCTLSNSGEWNLGGTGPHTSSTIDFSGTLFNNTRGTYNLGGWVGNATSYTQTGCIFMAQIQMANQTNITWDKCYFHKIPEVSGTTGTTLVVHNCFIRKATNSPLVLTLPPTFDGNYVYYDDSSQADPHILQFSGLNVTQTVSNCVIEANGNSNTQGDGIDALGSGTGARNITGNLILRCLNGITASGFLLGALGAASQTYTIEHNTVVGSLSSTPVYMGDAYNPHTGMIASFQSNLIGNDATATYPVFWNRYGDELGTVQDNVITTCGHNNVYGGRSVTNNGSMSPASGSYNRDLKSAEGTYYGTPQTTNPQATDKQVLPSFVDSTRRLTTWAVIRGYATSGQTQSQKESAAYTALQAAPSTLIADLISWVRAGYAPTNNQLRAAAHDGGDIGAIAVVATSSGGSQLFQFCEE